MKSPSDTSEKSEAAVTGKVVRFDVEKVPEFITHFHILAGDDNYDSFNPESGVVKFKVTAFDYTAFPRLQDIDLVYLKYAVRKKEEKNESV